jgi:hypothetical protein
MKLYDELHEIAVSRNNAKIKREYDAIVANAREVAKDGGLFITRSTINETVKKMLEDDGLTINRTEDNSDRYPVSVYKISWESPRKTTTSTGDYWANR